MPTIIAQHTIKTFVDPGNPTHVGVMMNVPDMDAGATLTPDGGLTLTV